MLPVGITIMFADNEDHSNHAGKTWIKTSVGRAPVGIDTTQAEFNSIGKTGGLKENRQGFSYTPINASKGQDAGGEYQNAVITRLNSWLTDGGSSVATANVTVQGVGGAVRTGGTINTEVTYYRYTTPNLQPYEVFAFWKRTA